MSEDALIVQITKESASRTHHRSFYENPIFENELPNDVPLGLVGRSKIDVRQDATLADPRNADSGLRRTPLRASMRLACNRQDRSVLGAVFDH